MSEMSAVPWGLTRMKPFPATAVLTPAVVVLDPESQTGLWVEPLGTDAAVMKHKRSETSKETSTRTSLDGNTDQGSDQDGDTD